MSKGHPAGPAGRAGVPPWRYPMTVRLASFAVLPLLLAAPLAADEPKPYPPPEEVRASFKKMLDRPAVPPDPVVVSRKADGAGRTAETLTVATQKKADGGEERVPVLVVKPAKA